MIKEQLRQGRDVKIKGGFPHSDTTVRTQQHTLTQMLSPLYKSVQRKPRHEFLTGQGMKMTDRQEILLLSMSKINRP